MKKFIVIIAIICVLGGLFFYDFFASKSYKYENISATNEVITADGVSPTKFTVRLTKDGQPVAGHTINVVASNGTLRSSRIVTDGAGEIVIIYYAFLYLNDKLTPMEDVTFTLSDEDNSSIIMVPARYSFTVKAVKPEDDTKWDDWQHLTIDEEENDG